jgi:phasin family protein
MMSNQPFDNWVEMNRKALEPMVQLNEMTAKLMDQVSQQQLALTRDYMELGARQLQLMGQVKDPQTWVNEEGKLMNEFGQKFVERAEEFLRVAKTGRDDVAAWTETAAKAGAAAVVPKTQRGLT